MLITNLKLVWFELGDIEKIKTGAIKGPNIEIEGEEELINVDDVGRITDRKVAAKNRTSGLVKRQVTTSKTLAGGDNMAYIEYNRNAGGQFTSRGRGNGSAPSREHHPLFKKHMGRK
ncbi:hypothetical protein G6F68_016711 [Rhizopus microsporus]|nr:hypothetical protein G6F68_016711 [Rhizopus microsporus]